MAALRGIMSMSCMGYAKPRAGLGFREGRLMQPYLAHLPCLSDICLPAQSSPRCEMKAFEIQGTVRQLLQPHPHGCVEAVERCFSHAGKNAALCQGKTR